MSESSTMTAQEILARTMWGEARGEGTIGMQAVGCVVLNRVAKPKWWGNDISSVCLKHYQFSCWLTTDPNFGKLMSVNSSDPQFVEALSLSSMAVNGQLNDVTNGATSYYRAGTTIPSWAVGQTPCATIGHHIFFDV